MSNGNLVDEEGVKNSTESVKVLNSAFSRVTTDIRAAIIPATQLYHGLK